MPILYNGEPFPSNLSLPIRGFGPHLIRFRGPIRAHNPNGISFFAQMGPEYPYTLQWATPSPSKLALPVSAGLTTVTDRQTDHATRSVTIGCIYVRSTAM